MKQPTVLTFWLCLLQSCVLFAQSCFSARSIRTCGINRHKYYITIRQVLQIKIVLQIVPRCRKVKNRFDFSKRSIYYCLAGVPFSCISQGFHPCHTIGVWTGRNPPPQTATLLYHFKQICQSFLCFGKLYLNTLLKTALISQSGCCFKLSLVGASLPASLLPVVIARGA